MADTRKMTADEIKWRNRDNARILADAERIKGDSKLLKGAQREARAMAQEQMAAAKNVQRVTTIKPSTSPKPTKKK